MEDLIDIRNRKEQKNVVKWYNCNYEEQKNIIGEEGNEMYLPLENGRKTEGTKAKQTDPATSYAEDVLNKINQARDDKVMAAILEGMTEEQ